MKDKIKGYKEINISNMTMEKSYKDPMTKTYQYEYALYKVISNMFGFVTCRSMCIERLRLYFLELPHRNPENTGKAKTAESVMEEMTKLVERDLSGRVTFPQMHQCKADVKIFTSGDGSHIFIFTDGIYGFSVRLSRRGKDRNNFIEATDISANVA